MDSPILEAANAGRTEIVKLLLDRGVPAFCFGMYCNYPLLVAASSGHLECVKILHEHGSPLEEPDINNEYPLYKAARGNHIDVVRYLLSHGAGAQTQWTDTFDTALISASRFVSISASITQPIYLLMSVKVIFAFFRGISR